MSSRKLKSRAWASCCLFRSSLWQQQRRFPGGFRSILFFTQKIKGDESYRQERSRRERCRVQKLQIAMKKQAAFFFIHNEPKELEMMLPAFCPQKDVQRSRQSRQRQAPGNTWWTQWSKLPRQTWNPVQRRRPSTRRHVVHCIFQHCLPLHNKSVETGKREGFLFFSRYLLVILARYLYIMMIINSTSSAGHSCSPIRVPHILHKYVIWQNR